MNYNSRILIFCISVLQFACSSSTTEAVKYVDLNKFMGEWYEISALPTTFNKGCTCSKISMKYDKESGYVKVINSCIKKGKQGAVLAKAFIMEDTGNAKWKMQLFWPFKSDYYILNLADDYSYALVGNPDYSQLQLLSRTPELPKSVLDELLLFSATLGYNTGNFELTDQDCE